MNAGQAQGAEDSSWVVIDAPLAIGDLRAFCEDLERLYRINPYLEIRSWTPAGADAARVDWRNLSNQQAAALELHRTRESDDAFSIGFSEGLKRATHFRLEAAAAGSRLTVTDRYDGLPREERERRFAEVDRSLAAWGWALHAYLRREHHWGRNPLWRWGTRRLWLPLRPSSRRIGVLIGLVTLAEFAFFLLVALIWWSEHR